MAITSKPRVRVPAQAKAGEIIEIKTLISHEMESGQRKDSSGKTVPRDIIISRGSPLSGRPVITPTTGRRGLDSGHRRLERRRNRHHRPLQRIEQQLLSEKQQYGRSRQHQLRLRTRRRRLETRRRFLDKRPGAHRRRHCRLGRIRCNAARPRLAPADCQRGNPTLDGRGPRQCHPRKTQTGAIHDRRSLRRMPRHDSGRSDLPRHRCRRPRLVH